MTTAAQIAINGLLLGSIYCVVALGITLIFSIMKTINFAHGQLYMLGSFIVFYLSVSYHVNYYVALVIGAGIMFLVGAGLERGLFRWLRGRELPSLLLSIGIALGIEAGALLAFGPLNKGIPLPITHVFNIGGVIISGMRLFIIITSALLFIGLYYFVNRVKVGQGMRALAQDPEAASLQGIDINRLSWLGFGISSALAGVAGGLLAPIFYLQPAMGMPVLIKSFLIIVLGGLGSITGCLVGALILGFLESIVGYFLPGNIALIIAFILVIVLLATRPRGILGLQ